jgi:hypothetical protein
MFKEGVQELQEFRSCRSSGVAEYGTKNPNHRLHRFGEGAG